MSWGLGRQEMLMECVALLGSVESGSRCWTPGEGPGEVSETESKIEAALSRNMGPRQEELAFPNI